MEKRLKIDAVLREILGSGNVYFQPPPSLKMNFPCITYERVRINTRFADNYPYHLYDVYQVTHIDIDPDSDIPDKLSKLPQCVFERFYINDNKYYNVFRITN